MAMKALSLAPALRCRAQEVRVRTSSCSADRSYSALLVDVGGTLLETSRPVAEVYSSYGTKYGVNADAEAIKRGFKRAFAEPWPERLRYDGDGRRFWRYAVAAATGCDNDAYFEELYQYFARADAWKLAPGAYTALEKLRAAGVKLAVVSNFDTRLRPILEDLEVASLLDGIVISSEIGYEKPAKEIFQAALSQLDVGAADAVHVGDDPVADKQGAAAVGIQAWLWKKDVKTFEEISERILGPARR